MIFYTDISRIVKKVFRMVLSTLAPSLRFESHRKRFEFCGSLGDGESIVRPQEQLGRFNYANLIFAICTIRKCRIITENPIGKSMSSTKA